MSLAGSRARLFILAAIVVAAGFTVLALRDGASADIGTEGYNAEDFCSKLARLDFVMTSGFEHQEDIGLPATVFTEVKCLLDQSAGTSAAPAALIPVKLEGNLPWVDVTGDFIFNGDYMAEGHGTVAGHANTRVVLDVVIATDYTMTGTYTMGADGELGTEAVYAVTGEFGTATAPTPTQSGQTPEPVPTATPGGQQALWGDNNCSGQADPVDALLTLRHDAGLSANTGECPDLGTQIALTATLRLWGDFDCSDAVDPIDALKLLRFDAGLSVGQNAGCPQAGSEVSIQIQ